MDTKKINRMLEIATELKALSDEMKPFVLFEGDYEHEKCKWEINYFAGEILNNIVQLKNNPLGKKN